MTDTTDSATYAGSVRPEEVHAVAGELESAASTTLVEVIPGVAVLFGEVPNGVELIDLNLIPSFDRTQLSTALGSLGNAGTVVGNVAEAVSSAQGLFRVDDATLALLKSGGQMAAKDGAKLGAIFKNGKLVAQARFIPASMTAATAIAAIGPAISMIALQMQIGEISGLVRTNIALTTQTLKTIRNEQWSELEGLAESVDEALREARELEVITDTVWEPIASSGPVIRKQLKFYRKNVAGHVQELGRVDGRARRQYLETNAEAIVFDTHALLSSLKTHVEYQTLRAALARTRSATDENEAQLFDRITRNTPPEIEELLREIAQLTVSLARELRIVAELPGRATMPLTKKRKDAGVSKLTCAQLLESIEPLTRVFHPAVEFPSMPDTVCAPKGIDLDPYLRILQWFLEDGEKLRGIAFPYEVETNYLGRLVSAVLAKRVDATWEALAPGRTHTIMEKFASCTFVAVTDRRIITANPRDLLRRGELGPIHSLDEVQYVRPRSNHGAVVRPTIDVTTDHRDIHWMFPDAACHDQIDDLATILWERKPRATTAREAIEQAETKISTVDS